MSANPIPQRSEKLFDLMPPTRFANYASSDRALGQARRDEPGPCLEDGLGRVDDDSARLVQPGRIYLALDAGSGAYLLVCVDRDPQKLAALKDHRIKASRDRGYHREDYLLSLEELEQIAAARIHPSRRG
mgnify:CR=1 FL=1